jgi:hypothetical protein
VGLIRILLGAIDEVSGGPALVLTRGVAGPPAVTLTEPNGNVRPLVVTPSPVASSGGGTSPLAAELAALGVALHRVDVPPLRGVARLRAQSGFDSVEAVWRPFPVAPRWSVSFSLSSCYYGYFRFGTFGRYLYTAATSTQLAGHQIDFKLLVGDNLYMDVAPDQGAFGDGDAAKETAKRYVDYFVSDDDVAIAGATSPTILTFDDHDLWNDYPHASAWLSRSWSHNAPDWTRAAWDGIDTFQMPLNPRALNAASRSFSFVAGGVPFFVADTRSHRSIAGADDTAKLLTPSDLGSLEAFLRAPGGPRVLVVGQPLWQKALDKVLFVVGDHNLAAYPKHFARILEALRDCPADVLLLTGDPHFSRILELRTPAGRSVYEVTSSPAVHIPAAGATVRNNLFGGGFKAPASSAVSIDEAVEYAGDPSARLSVARYLHGTSANTAFALLTLSPRADGSIDTRVTFVDHQGGPSRLFPSPDRVAHYPTPVAPQSTVSFTLKMR